LTGKIKYIWIQQAGELSVVTLLFCIEGRVGKQQKRKEMSNEMGFQG